MGVGENAPRAGPTVLVTGGCGFIGSQFVRLLRRERPAWQVVNLDLMTYAAHLHNLEEVWAGQESRSDDSGAGDALPADGPLQRLDYGKAVSGADPGHVLVRGDVADAALVDRLFTTYRLRYVVHFAAESHVDRSILDPAPFVETNVRGTQVLLEAARRHGVERFVQVSTDEVYGDLEGLPAADEQAPLRPSSPYSASKAAGDLMALAYVRTYGLPAIVTRSSNNYGPHQFPEKLLPLMIWKALRKEPLPVYGDGLQVRDWLWVEDNCRAILAVLERGRPGEVYNIAAGNERSNLEVVGRVCDLVAERTGREPAAVRALVTHVQDRPGHDRRYAMTAAKVQRECGWAPRVSLEEGLARTVDWYLARSRWVERVVSGEWRRYWEAVYERGWSAGR
ncbi:dTDP-glucose 4,6-dehydratase [Carboxydochorda subterranea]|uniref:dTDP-glucose 4,6-dehydratase n=1 Tax=Carboxydichorda subterranea TaxID=3109565 RepID=A0ABZ1BVQ4_9FIRM|nr:dTDP-glucose 4,6-dehydratase [Limnochorda sp. L945t]WRP16870.1 dTDP-glucose 4,6-dehydratase [Limnochorda sp. L945t]